MRRRMLAICAAVVVTSGCYHITVVTGARESSTRPITKPFQMSFVSGIVPPPEIQADQEGCADGVAKVETWHSFVNMLVSGLSSSIITPISVTVTCAASVPGPDTATPSENGQPSSLTEPGRGAAEGQKASGTAPGG